MANASIVTGAATAIGNDSTTSISQSVLGTATGSGVASASQSVAVGNLGLALANTGLNGAIAGGGLTALPGPGAQLANAQNELQQFMSLLTDLTWLTSANPFEQFAQTVHLEGLTLTLGGNIQGSEFLVGWDANLVPEGGPIPGGVRVRQISGVLDIGIAVSDSGHNVVIAVVDNDNGAAGASSDAGPVGLGLSSTMNTQVAAANAFLTPANTAQATIATGDAMALGNGAVVFVCQTFNDSEACLPESDPPDDTGNPGPSDGPGTVGSGSERPGYVGGSPTDPAGTLDPADPSGVLEAEGPSSAGTLPLTGGDPRGLVGAGLGLVAAGGLLASRRRANRKGLRVVRS
jgi:LPXTG-motif cell wall-anchored protein